MPVGIFIKGSCTICCFVLVLLMIRLLTHHSKVFNTPSVKLERGKVGVCHLDWSDHAAELLDRNTRAENRGLVLQTYFSETFSRFWHFNAFQPRTQKTRTADARNSMSLAS